MVPAVAPISALPALVDRAVAALMNARSAAEVLEARDLASIAYDAAKKAARLSKAKRAHDELIAAAYRTQADALAIESEAKRRLADEYDAAQQRGEVARIGDNLPSVPERNAKATAADVGLSRKDIHEARKIRDAEEADPGIVRRTVDAALAAGEEPTKAKLRRAIKTTGDKKKTKRRARYSSSPTLAEPEPRHDADLRRLEVAWEAACPSAREAFLRGLGAQLRPSPTEEAA
jgi:hypothetical protein